MSDFPIAIPPASPQKSSPVLDETKARPVRVPPSARPREDMPPTQAEGDAPFDVLAAFVEHRAELFSFALNGLGDRAEAADCVQETFIRAWRNRDRYSSSLGSVRTWLFAIERNLVVDFLRARARRPAPSEAQKIDWASEPVTEDLLIVERLALYESLATLSPEHREVIAAVKLDGLGYQELSEQTGVPIATLRTRMYYGLRSLRTALDDHADEEEAASARRRRG